MKKLAMVTFVFALAVSGSSQAAGLCGALFESRTQAAEAWPLCGPACVLNVLTRERNLLTSPSSEPQAELQNLIEVFAPRVGITPEQIQKGLDATSVASLLQAYFKTQGVRGKTHVFGGVRDDLTYPRLDPANTSFRRYLILKYDVFFYDPAKKLRPGNAEEGWLASHYVVVGSTSRNADGSIAARFHDPRSGVVSELRLKPFKYSSLGFSTYELVPKGAPESLGTAPRERAFVTNVIAFDVDSNSGLQH